MKERPKEIKNLTLDEIVAINPTLKKWFISHSNAVLDGNKRLLSAEEKIKILGGSEQIKKNYHEARKSMFGNEYLVLSACYRDPMHGYEIAEFCFLSASKTILPGSLFSTIDDLIENDLMVKKEGLTLVILNKDKTFSMHNRTGYLTTDEGFRKRVEVLERREKRNPLGQLAPQP